MDAGLLWFAFALTLWACGARDGRSSRGDARDSQVPAPVYEAGAVRDAMVEPVCGDFVRDEAEECDDGNDRSDDGCSARCGIEVAGAADVCPGVELAFAMLPDGSHAADLSLRTDQLYHQYSSHCGGSGPDAVVMITAPVRGWLTVRANAEHDVMLYARRSCDDGQSEVLCSDGAGVMASESFSTELLAGEALFVFVDALARQSGAVQLTARLEPMECGNGVLEGRESCEDMNDERTDGCAEDCLLRDEERDQCPGYPLRLHAAHELERNFLLRSSRTGTYASQQPLGCRALASERVYGVVADRDGTLRVALRGDRLEHTLYVRTMCREPSSELTCIESGSDPRSPRELVIPVRAEQEVYLVVDGQESQGVFELALTMTPVACGNRLVDPDERCDDGNELRGDGCYACQLEDAAPELERCDGAELALTAEGEGSWRAARTGSTLGLVGDFEGLARVACAHRDAPDAVFQLRAPVSGTLTAQIDSAFDAALQLRTACDIERALAAPDLTIAQRAALRDQELRCHNERRGAGVETMQVPVEAGRDYFLIVSAPLPTQSGLYHLQVELTRAACGNLLLEGGESCDDGNQLDGDGCTASCQKEQAGPEDSCPGLALPLQLGAQQTLQLGLVHQGAQSSLRGERCRPAFGNDLVVAVTPATSGKLRAQAQAQGADLALTLRTRCDDASSERLCRNDLPVGESEQLGAAVAAGQTYYVVVKALTPGQSGPVELAFTLEEQRCGDGFLGFDEACDDGNTAADDGCAPDCTAELATQQACPGLSVSVGAGESVLRSGSTAQLTAAAAGSCGGSGRDAVYRVVPGASGTLLARVTANFSPVLYMRADCAASGSGACHNDGLNEAVLRLPAVANRPLWLFVDGDGGQQGAYQLSLQLATQ